MKPDSFKSRPKLSEPALIEKLLSAYSPRTEFIEVLEEEMASPLPLRFFDLSPHGKEHKDEKIKGYDNEKEDYILQIADRILEALKDMRDKRSLSALDSEQKQVLADHFIPLLTGLKREHDELIEECSKELGDDRKQARNALDRMAPKILEEFDLTGQKLTIDEMHDRLKDYVALERHDITHNLVAFEHRNLMLRIVAEAFTELCERAGVPLKKEYRNAFSDSIGSPAP